MADHPHSQLGGKHIRNHRTLDGSPIAMARNYEDLYPQSHCRAGVKKTGRIVHARTRRRSAPSQRKATGYSESGAFGDSVLHGRLRMKCRTAFFYGAALALTLHAGLLGAQPDELEKTILQTLPKDAQSVSRMRSTSKWLRAPR